MDERLGSFEVGGVVYPLNYSMRIAQRYNDAIEAEVSGDFAYMERNMEILALLMDDGAAYKRAFGGEEITPPGLEKLRLSLTPADNQRVSEAILDTLQRAGIRTVEAKPGKNAGAAPESGSQIQKKD